MKLVAKCILVGSMFLAGPALAQEPLRIGVLTDLSGTNADVAGPGSVLAAQMAVEDFGGTVAGRPIEVLSGDHQNRADIAASISRKWVDEDGVRAIFDLPITPAALAAIEVAKDTNVAVFVSAGASSDLTGKYCTDVSAHWTYDTYALAAGTARGVYSEENKKWFFLTADYTFGENLRRDAARAVEEMGGTVIGEVRHPRETSDMSSYLLQAQASGANVIALANSSGDTSTAVKQAAEFGIIAGGQKVAALLAFLTDIDAIGLETAQGMAVTEGFYWDFDDQTRAWSERFTERHGGNRPTMAHAGVYSSVLNYLKAVDAIQGDGGREVMAQLRTMPIEDMFARNATLRKDGRLVHDMYVFEVKSPEESTGRWDYYNLLNVVPADQAYRPLAESECPLLTDADRNGD